MEYSINIWKGEFLGKEVCIDTETTIAPFHTRDHKLVCFQAYGGGDKAYFVRLEDIRRFFNKHYVSTFILQNATFDVSVLLEFGIPKDIIAEIYDENRIRDTKILYSLYILASRGYIPQRREASLASMCKSVLGIDIFKGNEIRCTFDQYLGAPVEDISEAHKRYAMDDVVHTFNLYCELLALVDKFDVYNTLLSHDIQIKGDLALDQMKKNGIGVDLERVTSMLAERDKETEKVLDKLSLWGYIPGKPGIKGDFLNILDRFGILETLPTTDKGNISTEGAHLEDFKHIQFIRDYLTLGDIKKEADYLRKLSAPVVHPSYNFLVRSGRTSCEGIQFQNPPREGGVRECFIPQKGNKFIDVDYSSIEMYAIAQICINKFGFSRTAEALNDGLDPHIRTASEIWKVSPDMVTGDMRQRAKAANYGFPGGMGAETFIKSYGRAAGITTVSEAEDIKKKWLEADPALKKFLEDRDDTVVTLTGRVRADVDFCSHKNTQFQGLAADGAKIALYESWKDGVLLRGFAHDAILSEREEENAEEELNRVSRIMIDGMQKVLPDMIIKTEGKICDRYQK